MTDPVHTPSADARPSLIVLAEWLRSQAAQFQCAPWQDDSYVKAHIAALTSWADEVTALASPAQQTAPVEVGEPTIPDAIIMRIRSAGAMLSNCAYNLAQAKGRVLTEHDAQTLDECRKEWDAARDALRDFWNTAPQPKPVEQARSLSIDERAAIEFYALNPSAALIDLRRRIDSPVKPAEQADERIATALAESVRDLNAAWNAKEPEDRIAARLDLARRLANVILTKEKTT